MPITPYSAPLQYEYKPLNLMAFAAPLSKMQEEFDLVTDTVESSDFDLQHLSLGNDPERAQALLNTVRGKRDELAKNLAETKNYKQAATKLKQLNNTWKNDPEVKALQANYAAYADMQKTAEENVKSNYWDQEQANEWLARAKRSYKGANFESDANNPEGTYKSYGLTARGKNLDKEFEEMVWNIAKAIPEHKYDAFSVVGIDPDINDKEFLKTIVEVKDPNVAAAKISAYLKTIPRFRQYFTEAADYKFDAIKNAEGNEENYKTLAGSLNDQLLKSVDSDLANYQKLAKKDPKILNSQEYLDLVEYKTKAEEAKKTGVYDDELTRQLYMQDQLNDRYNMSSVGNVIGYKNVTHDHIFRDMPNPTNADKGKNEDGSNPFLLPAEDMKFNIFSIKDDISKAKKNLHGYVVNMDNISGGAMREVVLGSVGSDRRKKMTNDDAAIYEAQVTVRNALVTSTSVEQFRKKLKDAGMNPSTRLVNKLYGDLKASNSVGLQELNDGLTAGEVHYNSGATAAENYKFIQQGAYEDKDIKKVMAEVGTLNPFDFSDAVDVGDWGDLNAKQVGELNQIRHVFSSRSYSQEQLKKAGINTSNNRGMSDFITGAQGVLLTYDEVAKLHGYKNFHEAVIKGYDFGGVTVGSNYAINDGKLESASTKFNLGSNAKEMQQSLLAYAGNKGLEVNKMSYDLINDQRSQKELGQAFSTINKVIAYAGTTSYQGMPGFDDKGNPLEGTKIAVGGNKQPIMTLHGGQVYVQVPYSYEGGEGMITIKPKTGTEDYIYSALNRIDKATAGSEDRLKKQTNATIKNAKFVQVYGNTINDVRANSPAFAVDAAHPEKTLGVITIPDPMGNPMVVEVVKRHSEGEGGGSLPYYTVKYPGGKYVGRFNDINALRADMMIGR
jgi:hypothetical protein